MIRITQIFALSAISIALTACNSSSSEPSPSEPPAPSAGTELRVHHASANAPMVNIMANGEVLADLSAVDYQTASAVLSIDAGEYNVMVDGILPGDETTTVIDADLDLAADVRYDVFALGTLGADGEFEFGPLVIDNPVSGVPAGEARLQVLHGAPLDATVDVYLTEPGADITNGAANFTLSYRDYTDQLLVDEGDYQVTLTAAGNADAVLFTSPTLTLGSGDDLFITATMNTAANAGDAPLALLVADGAGSSVVYSTTTGADVRVVHAAADVPEVDVHVNAVSSEPAIANLDFGEFTGYTNLAADDYEFLVTLAGESDAVLGLEASLTDGWVGTVFAAGELGNDTLNLQPLVFDNRRVATEARVRLVHASPVAGDVDIYVTSSEDISGASPAFSGVPFDADELVSTGNVALEAGTYFITITPAGSMDAALGPLEVSVEAGGIYTAIAVGNDAESLGVILLDDFADD